MDETEILSGTISVVMGGQRRALPVLKINKAGPWRAAVIKAFGVFEKADKLTPTAAMNLPAEKILDLVVVYDHGNLIGGKAWIEENATDKEVYDAFIAMWNETFPYKGLARDLLTASLPAPVRSPNGRSPSGVLTPIE